MFAEDKADLCVFYCLSPLHAGTGQAVGAVDLPIQRERHTAWPQVQASGVKGAFRDWFLRYWLVNGAPCRNNGLQAKELTDKVFGKAEKADDSPGQSDGQAGAVSVSDARLLAFPVRSNVAPFVWVTCPAVITRLKRDVALALSKQPVPIISPTKEDNYVSVTGDIKEAVVLEDLAVSSEKRPEDTPELAELFKRLAPQVTRLLVISDACFSFLVRTATEIQPQIQIEFDTGTTKDGSLRYQELLPSDSVLYTLVFFGQERTENSGLLRDVIRAHVKTAIGSHIRMGGDMTMGRGLMEVQWITDTPAAEAPNV
ncbi:MAG: type III-B CRISPR module RAMP protein Cmr4 [Pseudomonadota bacterium]